MERLNWRQYVEEWPGSLVTFDLDPQRTGLMVVDMQRHGCDPSLQYGTTSPLRQKWPEAVEAWFCSLKERVVPNIARLLSHCRENGMPVIYFTLGPEMKDGSDGSFVLTRRRAYHGSDGRVVRHRGRPEHEILAELKPQDGELVINKTTISAFTSTGIDQTLRHLGVEFLVFTGIGTDACVATTARDAADRGYCCVVVEDACTAQLPILHDVTLLTFAINFGRVARTEEVIKELVRTRQERKAPPG